jgi:hypothetical protein
VPFRTAQDVGQFVLANMPPQGAAPKPSEEDTWAIIAFALDASGKRPAQPLNASNAASVMLGR